MRVPYCVERDMRLSPHCFAVTGLGYSPPWSVNAGFITGGNSTLVVDTGANALSAATIYGYASTVRPGNTLLVVNTEKHFDHIGGNGYFRARGVEVYGHPGIQRTQPEFLSEIAEFNGQISNPARRAHREAEVFYWATNLTNPNRPIGELAKLDLGDCEIEILPTPGHTPTNISVFVPSGGVLFCGDCLTNRYFPNLDCGTAEDWREWLGSLDRIARLAPKIVVPGHGPVASGDEVAGLIETTRELLEEAIRTGFSPTRFSAPKSPPAS